MQITRPTDLKNLCLTCKELQELAVKPLYKEIVLELGGTNDTKLTAFVNPRNIGLKWIRKLDLYLAELPSLRDPEKTAYLMQANFSIRLLIEMLPNNILERFSWHPWTLFGADNLQLLYKKQRKMKWLEAIALDRNILPELEKWHDWPGVFEHATKLGLYPDSQDVLNYSAALLQRTKNLEKMTLHTSFDEDPDSATISTRELNDSSTGPGLITRTIFSHMMPFDNCTPIALRDLTLQKINLRYAADTYCRVIDFRQLKALRIFNCAGADALFAELSRSSRLPEKLEIIEFKHDDNAENDALNALDCLLTLVTGLKVMTFDLTFVKALPAVAGIVRNAKTLKELIVHASSGDHEEEELVYSFEDFEKICKNCEQLEQVSIAFPATSIVRENSDEFAAFEVCTASLAHQALVNPARMPSAISPISSPSTLPPGPTHCPTTSVSLARNMKRFSKAWLKMGLSAPSPTPASTTAPRNWPSSPGAPRTSVMIGAIPKPKSSTSRASRHSHLERNCPLPCKWAGVCASLLSHAPRYWIMRWQGM